MNSEERDSLRSAVRKVSAMMVRIILGPPEREIRTMAPDGRGRHSSDVGGRRAHHAQACTTERVNVSWSDPAVSPRGSPFLCSWTAKIFSHAQKSFGFFRRSGGPCSNWPALLPVLLKKCNIFCQQIKRSPSELDLHSWTALIQTRPMYFVFFEHLTEASIKEETTDRHIFGFAHSFPSAGFSADQDDFIQSSPSAGPDW